MHYKIERIIRVALPVLLLLIFVLVAATALTERNAQSRPSAARQDISAILEKDIWTAADYRKIRQQTGLGQEIADTLRTEKNGNQKILREQEQPANTPVSAG